MKRTMVAMIGALLLLDACDERPKPEPSPLTGSWSGMAVATWPGDVDQPVTDSGRITFEFFENGRYRFEQLIGVVSPAQYAEGNFSFDADSIVLSQTAGLIFSTIYTIAGKMHFGSNAETIVLTQVLRPDGWPESHTITLTKGIVPPIDLLGY
jgi:hypothetical protein